MLSRRTGLLVGFLMLAPLAAPPALAGATQVPTSRAEINLSFAPVVKQAAPAVVNIYTRKVVQRNFSPFANDPFFGQMFGNMFPGATRKRIESSLGSGVIVDPSGIVVSNYHVVGDADQITVVLSDRREFDGKVIFADKKADLAVVKLKGAHDLHALKLRNSDTLEVGDLVLAIGNPFGVGQTVTMGIVSALARSGAADSAQGSGQGPGQGAGYYIQTDAAINPGNSGGALIDTSGRLVGINSMILSRSGGSVGIGFAVPSNLVARVIAAAHKGQASLVRPWLGASTQPVTGDLASAMGLPRPEGVVISQLHPESPLAKAGISSGDVLLAVGGEPVNAPSELSFRLTTLGTGHDVAISYIHNGRTREAHVVLRAAPDSPPRDKTLLRWPGALNGLTVMNVNPAVIDEYGLPLSSSGVLVAGVNGPARASGFQPGDLILGAGGRDIHDVHELKRALARPRGLVLDVQRDGQRGSIQLGG